MKQNIKFPHVRAQQPISLFNGGNVAQFVIEEISLAYDDGNGKAGEVTDKFITTDRPIHCIIQIDSSKSATVKMNIMAVKANGLKPETKIVTVNYTTKENQNRINFTASPDVVWAAGTYRVDIFIDGKPARSQIFEIDKSPKQIDKEKQTPLKSLVPRKIIKKNRRN